MCWLHHRAYDTGRLDLLLHLEPRWRREITHAVSHLGLISAYRRLTGGRLPASDVATAEPPTKPGHGDQTTGGRPPQNPIPGRST